MTRFITFPGAEGMYICSDFLLSLCQIAHCPHLQEDPLYNTCSYPQCFLTFHNIGKYKWEEMSYSVVEGCYCYSDQKEYRQCSFREDKSYKCRRVENDFKELELHSALQQMLDLLLYLQDFPSALLFAANLDTVGFRASLEVVKQDKRYMKLASKSKQDNFSDIGELFNKIEQRDQHLMRVLQVLFAYGKKE